MSALVLEILDIFSLVHPQLQEDWSDVAIKWGTTCSDSHTACRSLQIIRALKPKVSYGMLAQMTQSLSAAVSDARNSSKCHSLDLLLTINQMYQSLTLEELLQNYPHLFWIAHSLMSSVHEWEYRQGLELMSDILGQCDLTQRNCIQSFVSNMPPKWPGGFIGLLPPLLRGLSSSKTCDMALEIMNSLLDDVPVSSFLDHNRGGAKMLFITLANLPKIVQPYEYESGLNDLFDRGHMVIETSLQLAEKIATSCSESGSETIAHFLISFSNQRIRRRDDFFRQFATIIKDEFRSVEGQVVKFCLSLLMNSNFIYPNCFLSLLECLWLDQSFRMNSTALPSDITGSWLRPLISLLENQGLGFRAARLLDVMLSVRLKASESEITKNVGGAQSIYAYVKRVANESFVFLPSGWLVEDFQSETAGLTKKRMYTVAKSLYAAAAPVESLQRKKSTSNLDARSRARLVALFADHESFFQQSAQALSV